MACSEAQGGAEDDVEGDREEWRSAGSARDRFGVPGELLATLQFVPQAPDQYAEIDSIPLSSPRTVSVGLPAITPESIATSASITIQPTVDHSNRNACGINAVRSETGRRRLSSLCDAPVLLASCSHHGPNG
jgi:hypothetical protein